LVIFCESSINTTPGTVAGNYLYVLEKHRINQATKTLICHNVGNWLQNIEPEKAKVIAPDATGTLVKANEEQKKLAGITG
jgi:hypothetical protein